MKKEEYELKNEDYGLWSLRNEVTYNEAACLLLNLNPHKCFAYSSGETSVLNKDIPSDIQSKIIVTRDLLEEARKRRELDETTPTGPDAWMAMPFTRKISISSLKEFSEKKGLCPSVLFPEENGKQSANDNPIFTHSPDYRSVRWKGEVFTFTGRQAQIIEILHKAYNQGTPDVGKDFILESLDSSTSRLRDAFRKSSAWRSLVVNGEKPGTYRLNL